MVTAALSGGLPSPIDIQVSGNSLETDHRIAQRIRALAATVPGAVDVRVKQRLDYPAIRVNVDRTRAAYLGLTPSEVVKNMVTSLNSSINFDPAFWIDPHNGNHYFLGAQYPEQKIESLNTLKDIPLTASDGASLAPFPSRGVPPGRPNGSNRDRLSLLRNVASFERTTAPTEVNHVNISRVIDVYANVAGRDVASVASDIEDKLGELRSDLPAGYSVRMRGEVESMKSSFRSLWFALALAAILIYLVMAAQFQSFLDPFIIMAAVPLALVGVVGALLVTGTAFSIQAFLGMIFIVGIAVSNKVLIVDFANHLMAEGHSARDAAIEAARVRLRPILMTSLATVIALLPMAIGLGHGSEANLPLARAVVGGHSVATVVSLFIVPILYVALKGRQSQRRLG